jgi:hypothetical protein
MSAFDLDKSISIEFHAEDSIERKMLGLWADERFKALNIRMTLVHENVVISIASRKDVIAEIPHSLFHKLAVKELAEIIIKAVKEKHS